MGPGSCWLVQTAAWVLGWDCCIEQSRHRRSAGRRQRQLWAAQVGAAKLLPPLLFSVAVQVVVRGSPCGAQYTIRQVDLGAPIARIAYRCKVPMSCLLRTNLLFFANPLNLDVRAQGVASCAHIMRICGLCRGRNDCSSQSEECKFHLSICPRAPPFHVAPPAVQLHLPAHPAKADAWQEAERGMLMPAAARLHTRVAGSASAGASRTRTQSGHPTQGCSAPFVTGSHALHTVMSYAVLLVCWAAPRNKLPKRPIKLIGPRPCALLHEMKGRPSSWLMPLRISSYVA